MLGIVSHEGMDTPNHTYHTTQQPHTWVLPKQNQTYVHRKTCMWMFVAALFITPNPNSNLPQRLGGQAR